MSAVTELLPKGVWLMLSHQEASLSKRKENEVMLTNKFRVVK